MNIHKYKKAFQATTIANKYLSDDEFLMNEITSLYHGDKNSLYIHAIKDLDGKYCAASQQYAMLCGVTHEDIIGKTEHDFSTKLREFADIFYQQDQYVIHEKKSRKYIDIHDYPHGIEIYITQKSAIINTCTNNVVGVMIKSTPFRINHQINIIKLFKQSYNKSYSEAIGNVNHIEHLSNLENEVLFAILFSNSL